MNVCWGLGPDQTKRIREFAVQDVLVRGMSIIGAAMVWDVQPEDLEHWVDQARDETSAS